MVDVATLEIRADSRSVRTASKDLGGMQKSAGLATGALRAFAPVVAAAFSAKALSGLAKQANEFSAAMGEVNTLLSDNTDMPRLTQEAKNLAAQFGGSPTQQAQSFYQAISAGASSAEEATSLLTAANKLAIGGVTDVTTAVDGLTSITNAYGIEMGNASSVSDAFFVAMKAGKTTVGELSGSIGKVAATASTAGLSFQETLGAISALTTQGIATTEAVTGLKATLTNILKPSKEASDAAEQLGIDFSLAGLQSKGLAGFLDELVTATGGSEEKMLKLFGSTEALNTIFALTGGAAETFDSILNDMANSAGETDKAFSKISGTMSQKLDVLKGKFAVTGIELGNFIVTASEPFVDALNNNFDDYIQYFKNLGKATSEALSGIIKIWAPWAKKVSEIVSGLFSFIVKIFSPIVKFFSDMISSLINIFVTFFQKVIKGTEEAGRKIIDSFRSAFTSVQQFIESTTVKISSFYDTLKTRIASLYQDSETTERRLAEIDSRRARSLEAVTKKYDEQRESTVKLSDQTLITETVFDKLGDTVDVVVEAFTDMDEETTSVDNAQLALDSTLTNLGQNTLPSVKNATNSFTTSTKQSTDAAELQKNMIENLQRSFGDLIFETLDKGKINFKSFFDTVEEGFKRFIAELASQKIMNAIFGDGGLNGFMSTLTSGFSNVISTIGGGIKSTISSMIGGGVGGSVGASTVGSTAGSTLGTAGAGAAGAGAGAGFTGGLKAIGTKLSGAGTKLLTFATNPITLAAIATAILANKLDSGGTPTSSAGFVLRKSSGIKDENLVSLSEFDSGFAPVGFKQNATDMESNAATDSFRALDTVLTDLAKSAGLDVNLNANDFGGYNVEGRGNGTFFGTASEDGKEGTSIDKQLDRYASQWIKAVGGKNNISAEVLSQVMGDGTAEGIIGRAAGNLNELMPEKAKQQMESLSMSNTDSATQALFNFMNGVKDDDEIAGPFKVDGSLARGMQRVPFDGYIAELHEGERVQTASQVKMADAMSNEMLGLRQNLNELMLVVAKSVAKTARIEDRWDKNGLPATRT